MQVKGEVKNVLPRHIYTGRKAGIQGQEGVHKNGRGTTSRQVGQAGMEGGRKVVGGMVGTHEEGQAGR